MFLSRTTGRQASSSRLASAFGLYAFAMMASASAVAEDAPAEAWKGDLSASITAQSGSVDTFAGAVSASGERDWKNNELELRFTGVYGTSRNRQNNPSNTPTKNRTVQDSQGLFSNWKHTIHERFFWRSSTELSRDSTQDREVRLRVSTGPGYRTWEVEEDPAAHHFDVSMGLGYRYEMYDGNTGPSTSAKTLNSLSADNGTDKQLAEVVAGFEYKNLLFNDRVEWTHTFSAALPVNDPNAYIIKTVAIAGIPLTPAWSFRVGTFYEYVNNVPKEVNPSTLRVTLGLGYKF